MASGFDGTRALCIPLLIAGASVAGGAYAQSDADAGARGPDALEEVTVTAQRRAQQQQNVPISLSALSTRDLEKQGLVSSDQLQVAVPAVSWTGAQFGSPYIRGIGAANVLPGSSTSVPIYIDGALLVSPQQANFGLYGIERVEVLKGPQGTLFGRNASGGVISIFTHDPKPTPAADFEVGYGNFQTTTANFYGNIGLTDTLFTNISLSYLDQGQGWGRNLTTGKEVYRERDKAVRWKLRWAPSDDTSWTLGVAWSKAWSDKNTWETLEGYVGEGVVPFPGWWNTRSGQESYFSREVYSVTLNGNTKTRIGDFVSITNYSGVREYWSNDVDGVAPAYLYADYNIPAFGFTQEFRLVGEISDLKWQTGVYFQNNRSSWDPLYVTGSNLGGAQVVIIADLADTAEAVYGDLTWTFLPDTRLTGGVRYSMNDEQVDGVTVVNGASGPDAFQKKHFQKTTWRGVLDHNFTPDLMVYGSVSTGFNQGTFNSTAPTNRALEPETVTAFEIGGKSEWFDHRLRFNADIYYQNYKNLQTQIVTKLLTQEANVGKVDIKGAEVELAAVPLEGLKVSLNYNYNQATYADFSNAVCVLPNAMGTGISGSCDATGKQVRISPKQAIGASLDYDLHTSIGTFSPSINESYKGISYWDFNNAFANRAHSVVNATFKYTPNGQPWALSFRGRNLNNARYWTGVNERGGEGFIGSPAEPRVYSINFEMHY